MERAGELADESDPQRMKKIAAAAYDYEIDPRWAEYWSNVLIPPHMNSRSDVVDHYKRKFYQRYIDSDFVVQPMSSTVSSQGSGASQRSSSIPSTENERTPNSRSSSHTSIPPGRTPSSLQMDKQTVTFAFNAWEISRGAPNTTTIKILSSNSEVALGFLFIISLFSHRRSIIHTFIYWQLLKLMYNVPATSSYHQSVWSRIGRTINPSINRYAPFLNTPIAAIKRWWLR